MDPFIIAALAALSANVCCCLLYTSDAADERSSVDLGGRRIIKKKKNSYTEWVNIINQDKVLREHYHMYAEEQREIVKKHTRPIIGNNDRCNTCETER